jgi:hypothetical protein
VLIFFDPWRRRSVACYIAWQLSATAGSQTCTAPANDAPSRSKAFSQALREGDHAVPLDPKQHGADPPPAALSSCSPRLDLQNACEQRGCQTAHAPERTSARIRDQHKHLGKAESAREFGPKIRRHDMPRRYPARKHEHHKSCAEMGPMSGAKRLAPRLRIGHEAPLTGRPVGPASELCRKKHCEAITSE